MRELKSTALIGLMLLLGLLLVGCSEKSADTDNSETGELNLTDDFGGCKATDEAAAFGDSELESDELSVEANDPMATSVDMDSLRNRPDVKVYSVEFLWGHLELDSTEAAITDWSGSLTVERGGIVAVRLIRFELGDYIIRPRLSRQQLDFVSYTKPSFDGMLVFVYDPMPDSFDTENTLTFTSGPYSRTFTMTELAQISEVVEVGANQFSINGFSLERLECGEGFFQGRWVRPASDNGLGTFIGRWISQDGLLLGHLRGHFGKRDDGEQVMFGKWISVAGLFRGFLKGEWGSGSEEDPAASNLGWMRGEIFDRNEAQIGVYDGGWVQRQRGNDERSERSERAKQGLFRGQWSLNCD